MYNWNFVEPALLVTLAVLALLTAVAIVKCFVNAETRRWDEAEKQFHADYDAYVAARQSEDGGQR